MGTIRKIAGFLNPIRPFRGAAASALKPAPFVPIEGGDFGNADFHGWALTAR